MNKTLAKSLVMLGFKHDKKTNTFSYDLSHGEAGSLGQWQAILANPENPDAQKQVKEFFCQQNVVYIMITSGGSIYVGQTGKQLNIRIGASHSKKPWYKDTVLVLTFTGTSFNMNHDVRRHLEQTIVHDLLSSYLLFNKQTEPNYDGLYTDRFEEEVDQIENHYKEVFRPKINQLWEKLLLQDSVTSSDVEPMISAELKAEIEDAMNVVDLTEYGQTCELDTTLEKIGLVKLSETTVVSYTGRYGKKNYIIDMFSDGCIFLRVDAKLNPDTNNSYTCAKPATPRSDIIMQLMLDGYVDAEGNVLRDIPLHEHSKICGSLSGIASFVTGSAAGSAVLTETN